MGRVVVALVVNAVITLVFGLWSASRPDRSIAFYQTIMRAFNWRVEPIDRERELETTRKLGIALAGCSILTLLLLIRS